MTATNGALLQAVGQDALLCGYPYPGHRRWLTQDELSAQAFSAGSLCIAEGLPVLCGHLAASDLALDLLAETGWPMPGRLLVFRSGEELGTLIREQTGNGSRLVASFPLPVALVPAEAHLVPPAVRSFLNNKRNLDQLVSEELRPARRHLRASEVLARPEACFDRVLKVATDEATGGGHDLLLPPHSGDPALVDALLNGAEEAILEEFLPFQSSRCFNYLIDELGEPRFLGAPEQFLSDEGQYLGNWFRTEDRPDPMAVAAGADVCRRAAALGYRGAAGLDAGFLPDGSFKFFDLNFRMNGSTAPLLLLPDLQRRCEAPAALRTTLRGQAAPADLAKALGSLSRERRFLPLGLVLAEEAPGETEFLVSGFLPGSSEAEILEALAELSRLLGCG